MKRRNLLKHLGEYGCRFVREGSETVFGKTLGQNSVALYLVILKSMISRHIESAKCLAFQGLNLEPDS